MLDLAKLASDLAGLTARVAQLLEALEPQAPPSSPSAHAASSGGSVWQQAGGARGQELQPWAGSNGSGPVRGYYAAQACMLQVRLGVEFRVSESGFGPGVHSTADTALFWLGKGGRAQALLMLDCAVRRLGVHKDVVPSVRSPQLPQSSKRRRIRWALELRACHSICVPTPPLQAPTITTTKAGEPLEVSLHSLGTGLLYKQVGVGLAGVAEPCLCHTYRHMAYPTIANP